MAVAMEQGKPRCQRGICASATGDRCRKATIGQVLSMAPYVSIRASRF